MHQASILPKHETSRKSRSNILENMGTLTFHLNGSVYSGRRSYTHTHLLSNSLWNILSRCFYFEPTFLMRNWATKSSYVLENIKYKLPLCLTLTVTLKCLDTVDWFQWFQYNRWIAILVNALEPIKLPLKLLGVLCLKLWLISCCLLKR